MSSKLVMEGRRKGRKEGQNGKGGKKRKEKSIRKVLYSLPLRGLEKRIVWLGVGRWIDNFKNWPTKGSLGCIINC